MTSCTGWKKKTEVRAGHDQRCQSARSRCRLRLLGSQSGLPRAGQRTWPEAPGTAAWSQESQPFCARASGKVISEVLALSTIAVGNLEMERL